MMKRYPLSKKIQNKEWLNSLSPRAKRRLEICLEILEPEELNEYSSIRTAYKVARERYIRICMGEDPDLYFDVPIFIDTEKYKRIVSL